MFLKIRAIQDPYVENAPQFVCIDDFEESKCGEGSFCFGVKVYNCDKGRELIKTDEFYSHGKEIGNCGTLFKHRTDKYLLPDATMYIKLGDILRKKGKVFNKKLGRFIVKERRE